MSGVNQTLNLFEIIVFDDCSTDNTPMILQNLSHIIPILKVYRQKSNVGIARNVDSCLRAASGDFIIRLDSDDYLHPEFTSKLSELLLKYPSAGYAHAAVQEVDKEGIFLRQRKLLRKQVFQNGIDALKAASIGYRVAANIIMFRKDALINVGYLSSKLDFAEDYHLSATLAAAGFGNVYFGEQLSYYRVWTDAGNVRQRRKILEIIGLRMVFEDVLFPSYQQRGWNLSKLQKRKDDMACVHTSCLAWNLYTDEEKLELKNELFKFSKSEKVKVFAWIYLNGWGNSLTLYLKGKQSIKSMLKNLLLGSTIPET